MKAWRVGISNERTTPVKNASTTTCHGVIQPAMVKMPSTAAGTTERACATIRMRRRSNAIGQGAGDRSEHEAGALPGEGQEADPSRGLGQSVHEPGHGGELQPHPDQRAGLAPEEQPVVAGAEGAAGPAPSDYGGSANP